MGSVAVIYTCGDAVTRKDHKWYLYFIESVNVLKWDNLHSPSSWIGHTLNI